jgi:hypothetical protein
MELAARRLFDATQMAWLSLKKEDPATFTYLNMLSMDAIDWDKDSKEAKRLIELQIAKEKGVSTLVRQIVYKLIELYL